MTGRSRGTRPQCEPGCTCGHHPIEQLTNEECYRRAAPLDSNDFAVLARTFGMRDSWDVAAYAAYQQRKADDGKFL